MRLHALQESLAFPSSASSLAAVGPRPHHARVAVSAGFSLHADTWTHAHDKAGLERLCRYGARGPLAEERLRRLDDGRYAYRLKRPSPSGTTSAVFTAGALVRRLAALLPPPRRHLIRFHGVFGPNAWLRPLVVRFGRPTPESPRAPACSSAPLPSLELPLSPPPPPSSPPRLDWASLLRRTFAVDVLSCPCGGQRRVLAAVTSSLVAQDILRHLGRLEPPSALPCPRQEPQLALALGA